MKKLFDSKFLIISALSVITLILLIVFSFFLFDRDEAKFVKSGYIINPLNATSEKYFFNEGTGYRENLSSMVVFNSVDDKEVKVLRDSFVHYEDGSISLLKNGAILDVDSIHDNLALFYNITSDSIIERSTGNYYIESMNGNVNLKNFIVRISDNKYLVAGNVKLSYMGSPSSIDGEYFEIVYSEEGIVNIENKNFKYELSAEGTKVTVGDYVIDLGTKVLSYRDNDIMSITAITIDGNENVEIIPKKEETRPSSSQDNAPDSSSSLNPSGESSSPENPSSASSSDGGEGSGGSSGSGGSGTTPERINAPKISLKDAKVGATNVEVVFDIDSEEENNTYMLQVVNADTGNTIDITAEVLPDVKIDVNLLTPSTKYLFTVINQETKEQYFQKMFKTETLGVSLEKAYAKSDALTYKLTIGKDTQVSDATLTLYKFDEELGDRIETGKTIRLTDVPREINQDEYYLTFDGLDSDSIYIAVLDNFSLESVNFRDVYNISVTALTLKKTPVFPNEKSELMSVTESETADNFKLFIGNITDTDNAIISYTYYIYDTHNTETESDDSLALDPIKRDNASPIVVKLGNKNDEIHQDTNYYYKAVIEYFDNEKYIEYETIVSSNFIKTGKPSITVIPNMEETTHNQIAAKIFMNDKGCEIKLPDRPGVNCAGDNVLKIRVTKINKSVGENDSEESREIVADFNFEGESVFYPLVMGDLEAGTTYAINVYTYDDEGGLTRIPHTSDSVKTVTTLTLANFAMQWTNPDSSKEHVVKLDAGLVGTIHEDAISIEESASKISKMVLELYDGDVRDNISLAEPIASKTITGDIKSLFFDNLYTITSDGTFGLTKKNLEDRNPDGKVSRQYTVYAKAYYGTSNEITLTNKAYLYSVPITVREDNISEPQITVDAIKNSQVNYYFDKVGNVTVGYLIHGLFVNDERILVKNAVFRVYDQNNNAVKFYVKKNGSVDTSHPVEEIKYTDIEGIETDFEIYMDYGIDYNNSDQIMRRGNKYVVGYYLEVLDTESNTIVKYPDINDPQWPYGYGVYYEVSPSKETPSMKMYVSSSDANSVTYKYFIKDADNAIYKDIDDSGYSLYYTVNNGGDASIDLTEVSTDNKFEGSFTISNLDYDDTYGFYYKLNVLKTGDISQDIQPLNDTKIKDFRFTGVVDSTENNFNYKVINQPGDNRVVVVMLSDEKLLNNTFDYTISFTDSVLKNGQVNQKTVSITKLSSCDDAYDISGDRCYFMDYATLKALGMKSSIGEIHNITVTVSANYDSGKMGYDISASNYIFSEIARKNVLTKYLVLDNNGNIVEWNRADNILANYYGYTKHTNSLGIITAINLKNKVTNVENRNIGLVLKNYGYTRESISGSEAIVPHEVKIENMTGEDTVFSFSSITPKAAPSKVISFLSGAGINLKISGIDLDDFDSDDRNLYIEIWENRSDVGDLDKVARPRVQVPIDENTSNSIENILVTGLHSYNAVTHPEYYCRIYAKINVNNQLQYIQLDDANSVEPIKVNYYSFSTRGTANILKGDDILLNKDANGSDIPVDYGERFFTTKFSLAPYTGGYDMDYNMTYVICSNDGSTCDLDHNIIKREISEDDMSSSITETFNVYDYDLVYGTNYRMFAYAKFAVYGRDSNNEFITSYETVQLTKSAPGKYTHLIRELEEPAFRITREAKYINDDYAIEFKINISDPDRVLQTSSSSNDGSEGAYYLSLTANDMLVGNLQIMGDSGYVDIVGYDDYSQYPFRASITNNQVLVGDLESETEYKVQTCGVAYINNLGNDENIYNVCSRKYSAYTSNDRGIAFGSITYTPTATSMIATFLGGSSLVNSIDRLSLTILDKTENRYVVGGIDDPTEYAIGASEGHYFEYNKQVSEEWTLILQRNMNNVIGHAYTVGMTLYDRDNNIYIVPNSTVIYYADRGGH